MHVIHMIPGVKQTFYVWNNIIHRYADFLRE